MSLYDILEIALYLSPVTLIFGIGIGLYYYRHITSVYKLLIVYFVFGLLTDLISRLLDALYGNNLLIIPIYGLIELIIFSWMYYRYLLKDKRYILFPLMIISFVIIVMDIIHVAGQSPEQFQSYGMVIGDISIIIYTFLFYGNVLNEKEQKAHVYMSLNATLLLFFSVNLLLYLPINLLVNINSEVKFYFWAINLVITIMFYSFLIYLIWKNGRNPKLLYSG
ncbi:hypothetical protein [Aquimarina algicola]|uniref:Uncharacterized protein n=1 Tax=Aquimarina algicola TaxID=2589995 RepID=A0A504J013_9FLAO|nr:hypothetical protein [Aquimarina algicola]TPN81742.1 hypothetical protein FHK87_24405 [Aquimarina algicola]